jgi:hypothetical protein
MSEGSLTGYTMIADACIEPVVLPFNRVAHHMKEGFHVRIFFEVSKQLKQKETDRVIGEAQEGILVGHNGPDEREVYKRGDKSRKPAADTAIGVNFDVAPLVGIF